MDGSDRGLSENPVLLRMQELLNGWETADDRREVFLRCYQLMTINMHEGIDRGLFLDGPWVAMLLNRFAAYYFSALDQWEADPVTSPLVWQVAHEHTRTSGTEIWQHLLLGVNAHINYDLVLTVTELLEPEWGNLEPSQQDQRYEDYCRVNTIIGETIDAVQDEIIAPELPWSAFLDRVLGRLDEMLISRFISGWRDRTWLAAMRLLAEPDEVQRQSIIAEVEAEALAFSRQLSAYRSKQ